MTKEYLVFRNTGPIPTIDIYKWDSGPKMWLLEDGSGFGHSLEKVNQYKNGGCFTQFDTREEAEEHIRYLKYAQKYGRRDQYEYDFKCPKCGYHHNDPREFEGYSSYPWDPFTLKCYCGYLIKGESKMVYEVS
jgi:hypothetical protein